MKQITPERVTAVIFWIGFLSFLSVSIPHVAWLYQQNEPDSWYTVVTSYGVAIGIDVLVAWLSYVCARGKILDMGVTVIFILLLSALSFYANYLFDMAHAPGKDSSQVWNIGILFGVTTTGFITPLVKSAIPFFALAYTFMLARLSKSRINLDELEDQFKHEQDLNMLRVKYGKDSSLISNLLDRGKQVFQQVKESNQDPETDIQTQEEESRTQDTDPIPVVSPNLMLEPEHQILSSPTLLFTQMSGRSTVSTSHAAKILEISEDEIKILILNDTLKHPRRSSEVVTVASLRSYLAEHPSNATAIVTN